MHSIFHAGLRLALTAGLVLLAACDRAPGAGGAGSQVEAAKAAVAHRLDAPDTAEFRNVVEYPDGTVCGEFNSRKLFSGVDIGFRKFIYNAPEPRQLVIDSGNLSPQDIGYWCSDQPDKRLRMLAASVAELDRECASAADKNSAMSCRLAATQKRDLAELQAAGGRTASVLPASAPAAPAVAAATAVPAAPAAPPAVPPAQASAVVAAAPAASPAPAPARAETAIPPDVEAALQSWREAWQRGDVEAYLRRYEAGFSGGTGSHAAWERERRQKMTNVRPAIGIEGLQAVRVTPQEVELRFVQAYAARQHRDTGDKTMVFRRSAAGWLIADERWVAR